MESPLANQRDQVAQHASHQTTARYPDMTGHWRIVTDYGDYQVSGSLDLVQHGRKVTGTLTNDEQIPGKFKGKFEKPGAQPDGKSGAESLQGILLGAAINPAITSEQFVQLVWIVTEFEFIKQFVGEWNDVDGSDIDVHGTSLK